MEDYLAQALSPMKLMGWLIFVLAGSLHEWGHAYSAFKLGDSTAKDEGRLSFNPIVHIDFVGTFLIPLFLPPGMLVFGWMKPVPVLLSNLEKPSRDEAIISWAGPFMNFIQAFAGAIIYLLVAYLGPELLSFTVAQMSIEMMIRNYILINIVLAFFNLIPVPPLDGGGIIQFFLPANGKNFLKKIAPYGIIMVFGFLYLNRYLPTALAFPYIFTIPFLYLLFFFQFYFIFAGLLILGGNYWYFVKKILRVEHRRGQKEFLKKAASGGAQRGAGEGPAVKNTKLYKQISKLTESGETAKALKILEPLQVSDANVCDEPEYHPDDEFCQQCEWFANCLKRQKKLSD